MDSPQIWETFGPTTQPFYRVQFNDTYPLDTEKVRIAREVFHIPTRSKFVSVSYLKQQFKGSDASNAHDEEPADDELEFSDDEAEREHKRALKDRSVLLLHSNCNVSYLQQASRR